MPRTRADSRYLNWAALDVVSQWMENLRNELTARSDHLFGQISAALSFLNTEWVYLNAEQDRILSMVGDRTTALRNYTQRMLMANRAESRMNALEESYRDSRAQIINVSPWRQMYVETIADLVLRRPIRRNRFG